MAKALVIQASHRAGGNTDTAADIFRQGMEEEGAACETVAVRDLRANPCQSCGACVKNPEMGCVLKDKDDVLEFFHKLAVAPLVFISAPIYFYHLPSMLKTVIDRGQSVWAARQAGMPWVRDLPGRRGYVFMTSGRPRGEKLFEGALITLRWFLVNFNIELANPLTIRGLDAPKDLKAAVTAMERVREYGRSAARGLAGTRKP